MELVCYFLYYYTGQASFGTAAFYALAMGVIMGWLAVFFGAIDLVKIPADKPVVLKKALLHGSINSTILIVYTIFFYSLYKKYPALPTANMGLLIGKACAVVVMIAGNYIGGSLILKDKIGIET